MWVSPNEKLPLRIQTEEATFLYSILPSGYVRIERCEGPRGVVHIPATIDGAAVSELADKSFSGLNGLEELYCPPTIRVIGADAFSNCRSLRVLSLPDELTELKSSWVRGSSSIKTLQLPQSLARVDAPFFNDLAPRVLRIGAEATEIDLSRRVCQHLEILELDAGNQHYMSDGACLYNRDGSILIMCATGIRAYKVLDTCKSIAPKAFSYFSTLEEVVLPKGLEEIGDSAFSRSGIKRVVIPGTVRRIGKKAFANASGLEEVVLEEGVQKLDAEAFADCKALTRLRIPASLQHISTRAFRNSGLLAPGSASDSKSGITIADDNPSISVGEDGLLYHHDAEGFVLIQGIDPSIRSCTIRPGTKKIAFGALEGFSNLEEVSLPESLKVIGTYAFMNDTSLTSISLPHALRTIGDKAFYNTNVSAFNIPASLTNLGTCALLVSSRCPASNYPELVHGWLRIHYSHACVNQRLDISVDPDNPRFFIEGNVFAMWNEAQHKTCTVISYVGEANEVRFPSRTTRVEPFAMFSVGGIDKLTVPHTLHKIGKNALFLAGLPRLLVIEEQGEDIALYPAANETGFSAFSNGFLCGSFEETMLIRRVDHSLFSIQDAYERYDLMALRLSAPVRLSGDLEQRYRQDILDHFDWYCLELARHDDNEGFQALINAGLLGRSNITHVIDVVSRAHCAHAVSYLLSFKEEFDHADELDFSL